MATWFIYAVFAFFLFGLWDFFPKLSTNYIHPKSALVKDPITLKQGMGMFFALIAMIRFSV